MGEQAMPRYIVIWADKEGLNPGDDYAALDMKGLIPDGYIWYQEFVQEAAEKRELDTIPRYWCKVGFISASHFIDASNLEELRENVAKARMGEEARRRLAQWPTLS